jgi:hypothetical protein
VMGEGYELVVTDDVCASYTHSGNEPGSNMMSSVWRSKFLSSHPFT